ncbi:hypothetical protein HCA69_02235 [Listeria grandensis]|uniref:SGNH hydrolase-type esterase domain-containing protein n=1 Tax=Listeria grandensis TaxID=1494963 RepID=A0A7X1CNP9_9LIST|nr:SGNH/GDSL hydrolase family protein [Listeria grandensis]MBC1935168.1 hypothetical protein [Listeria grandensis]
MGIFTKVLPEWLKPGTKPPSGVISGGWAANQKPPADYFNWFFNTTFVALQEIREVADKEFIKRDGSITMTSALKFATVADGGNIAVINEGSKTNGYATAITKAGIIVIAPTGSDGNPDWTKQLSLGRTGILDVYGLTIKGEALALAKDYLPFVGGEMSGTIASAAATPMQARLPNGSYAWNRGKQPAGTVVKVELRITGTTVYTRFLEITVGSGEGAVAQEGDFSIDAMGVNDGLVKGIAPMGTTLRYSINGVAMTLGTPVARYWYRVTRSEDGSKAYLQFGAPLDFSGIDGTIGAGVNFIQSHLRFNGRDVAIKDEVLLLAGGELTGTIHTRASIAYTGKVGSIKHYINPQATGTVIRFELFIDGAWGRPLDITVGDTITVGTSDYFIDPMTNATSYITGIGPLEATKTRATVIETGANTVSGAALPVLWWLRILRNFYDTCIQAGKNIIFSGYGNAQLEKVDFKTKSLTRNGKEIAISEDVDTAITKAKLPAKNVELLSAGFEKIRKGNAAKILAYGDSLTYGYDIYSTDKRPADTVATSNGTKHTRERASTTYPEALEASLKQIYPAITVQNWGYSGDTVLSSYAKWDGINPGADVTLFMLGHNDSKNATETIADFVAGYKKIIDRALNWGSGVIFLTPPKQQNGTDFTVDTYSQAVLQLAKEYRAPVIDMAELTAGISADCYSDSVHFNGKGYDYIGKKLASIFINKSILNMNKVKEHDSLTVTRENSGIQFNENCSYSTSEYFPTEDSVEVGKGNALVLKTGGKVYFSFYASEDNLLFLPSIYAGSKTLNLKMEVNFSAEPANTAITYAFNTTNARSMNKPLKSAIYTTADLNWYNASALYIDGRINASKLMYAPRKGYYTISIENLDTYAVNLFNFEFRNAKAAMFENNFLYTLGTYAGDILTLQPGNYEVYNSNAVNMPFATGLASIEIYGGGSGRKILKVKNLVSNVTWEGIYNPAATTPLVWNQMATNDPLTWTRATLKNGYSHFGTSYVQTAISADGKMLYGCGTGSVTGITGAEVEAFVLPTSYQLDFSAAASLPVQGTAGTARVLIDAATKSVKVSMGSTTNVTGVLFSFAVPIRY